MNEYRALPVFFLVLLVSVAAASAQVADKCIGDCGSQAGNESAAPAPSRLSDRISASTLTATATPFIFVFFAGGLVRLNVSSGGVQFCALTITNGQPTSACAKIATMPTASLSGNAQLNVVGNHVVLTNTATGTILDCVLSTTIFGFNTTPSGTCLTFFPPPSS
jgi:hypothetical protein